MLWISSVLEKITILRLYLLFQSFLEWFCSFFVLWDSVGFSFLSVFCKSHHCPITFSAEASFFGNTYLLLYFSLGVHEEDFTVCPLPISKARLPDSGRGWPSTQAVVNSSGLVQGKSMNLVKETAWTMRAWQKLCRPIFLQKQNKGNSGSIMALGLLEFKKSHVWPREIVSPS